MSCDSSPNRHATKHFRKTRHPIIEGYDPPEGWGWCYVDEISLDLVAFWPAGTLSMPAPSTPRDTDRFRDRHWAIIRRIERLTSAYDLALERGLLALSAELKTKP